MASTRTRDELYSLIDALPESQWETAARFLSSLRDTHDAIEAVSPHGERGSVQQDDPFLARLYAAPLDDEPTDADEDAGTDEAWEEYRRGQVETWESVQARLGGE
jgi:hypothetical protein